MYYLPSVLTLSSEHSDQWFGPADSLIRMLDRSLDSTNWDEFLLSWLGDLELREYDVLTQLLIKIDGNNIYNDDIGLSRAFDTLSLLSSEKLKRDSKRSKIDWP